MGIPRSVTVGTAGDGREAQRQEVGSNFRNTTRNTIDILSAIDFAKRLQAAAVSSGKEAMPNEQSKVYTRRPLAFEKLSEAQDRQLRMRDAGSLALWCLVCKWETCTAVGPDESRVRAGRLERVFLRMREHQNLVSFRRFSFLLFVFLAGFSFLVLLAGFAFLC